MGEMRAFHSAVFWRRASSGKDWRPASISLILATKGRRRFTSRSFFEPMIFFMISPSMAFCAQAVKTSYGKRGEPSKGFADGGRWSVVKPPTCFPSLISAHVARGQSSVRAACLSSDTRGKWQNHVWQNHGKCHRSMYRIRNIVLLSVLLRTFAVTAQPMVVTEHDWTFRAGNGRCGIVQSNI